MIPEEENTTPLQRFLRPLISGLLAFLPLALTLLILSWVVVFLHDLVGPGSFCGRILSSIGLNFVACEIIAYSFGLVGGLGIVYASGMLFEFGRAQRYQAAIESAVHRVPLVNTIYDASKHLTSMFDRKNENTQAMTPVICTFGGEDGTVVLALMPTRQPIRLNERDYHVVIIPTAPVPFGGALLCVPADCVKPADCSIDGFLNIFMSMGASAPQYLGTQREPETAPEQP